MKAVAFRFVILLFCLAPLATDAGGQARPDSLSDNVMRDLVGRLARIYIKPAEKPTTVYISDANIKKEWLPEIANVRFAVIPSGFGSREAQGKRGYILPWVRNHPEGGYLVDFGFGELDCGEQRGDMWSFQVREDQATNLQRTGSAWRIVCTLEN